MEETVESVAKWADETFGVTTPKAALARALQEIAEFVDAYEIGTIKLVEEAADVCITLYSYIYLIDKEAINKKMAINRARKWVVTGEGVGQHIEERESNP